MYVVAVALDLPAYAICVVAPVARIWSTLKNGTDADGATAYAQSLAPLAAKECISVGNATYGT